MNGYCHYHSTYNHAATYLLVRYKSHHEMNEAEGIQL